MRLCVALVVLVGFACAENVNVVPSPQNTAYGYIEKYGIPKAEAIRQAEERNAQSKIIGGLPAILGQYPSQAGLLGDIIGTDRRTACGASLVSANRLVTAAHCWNDGVHQVWRLTVVLGSTFLFTGGLRIETSTVALHPSWLPVLARNDIGVIYLPNSVSFSDVIAPVALPSGSEIWETFAGEGGIAVGFGLTSPDGGIGADQSLNHVRLNVITNSVCSYAFPFIIQPTHMCTSGLGGVSVCSGDSGGPLLIWKNGRNILAGVASFVSGLGCDASLPSVFTRVTSFLDFIALHM